MSEHLIIKELLIRDIEEWLKTIDPSSEEIALINSVEQIIENQPTILK